MPKLTSGNPLLLERAFEYLGSADVALLTTKRDVKLVLTTGSIARLLTAERDAERANIGHWTNDGLPTYYSFEARDWDVLRAVVSDRAFH